MNTTSWILPLCLLGLGAAACGGSVFETSPDGGGSGGGHQGSGSATATGGDGTGTGGHPGTGGDGLGCCLAAAVCEEGDTEIASKDECPPGASCYSNSICCSTVWCAKESPVNCLAIPACQEGEIEVDVCPDGASCEVRSLCGTSILCQLACDRDAEPHRTYVASSPEECALVDFVCDPDASYFSNACGCGCEELLPCPEYIDCAPKTCAPGSKTCVTGTDPLCSSDQCPNTPRVY